MNSIQLRLIDQLEVIGNLLYTIESSIYAERIPLLGHASVGQHVRHTLEIIQGLFTGLDAGVINYENRKRDLLLEINPQHALHVTKIFGQNLALENKDLLVEMVDEFSEMSIDSNLYRELHFVLEHTIHHMALIKIALRILGKDTTDENFGMSYSTIRYKETQCVQ
jgi:hypothetical protein